MSDANSEMEDNQKRINDIYKSIVQQFKAGDYQQAANHLKNAIERYPDNEKLQGLLRQIKLKVRDKKIKKLESEAMMLIQKGASDAGQKKLREILKLDPSRTDLQGSLKNLRSESREEYESDMRQDSIKKICVYAGLAVLFFVISSITVAAWDNRKRIKRAKEHISFKQYKSAVLELDKCGWILAGGKSDLYDQLFSIKEGLKEEADGWGEKKEYQKAIKLLQTASTASLNPEEFSEDIEFFDKLHKAELKAIAEAQKAKTVALQAKRDCDTAAEKARGYNPIIEISQLMSEAKSLSEEASALLAATESGQARRKWNQSAQKYNDAVTISIKIASEQKEALYAKDQCRGLQDVAKKANAEIEAVEVWQGATKKLDTANKLFDGRHFVQAREGWLDAGSGYAEALEICRRSPSYLKAQEELKKWKSLKNAMTESSVLNLLGTPNYSLMESDRCILFFQEVPRVVSDSNGNISILHPKSGYVLFSNGGFDIALANENKNYDKAIMVQNRRYDGELRRAGENIDSADRKKMESAHENKIKKINDDYDIRRDNLRQGITPVKPIYFVSQWADPDPDAVVSTLLSPQKEEEETDVKWQVQSNWARLKVNMEQRIVLTILGDTERGNSLGKEMFRFGNIQGFGELEFSRSRDNQLRLTYWKEPLWTVVEQDMLALSNSANPDSP